MPHRCYLHHMSAPKACCHHGQWPRSKNPHWRTRHQAVTHPLLQTRLCRGGQWHRASPGKPYRSLSAKEWIDDYVVLEAKALLKSTNMTIQQISYELNFPSQSFFGKYFKRSVGLSPLEYRKE